MDNKETDISLSNTSDNGQISLSLLKDGGSITDKDEILNYINSRRNKIKYIIDKESFSIKEEELNILRAEISIEQYKLLIDKQNWRREIEMKRIKDEDELRKKEDERRRIEDIRRKLEDERRRKEDERRREEDERRRKEDERRKTEKKIIEDEDKERIKRDELYQVHEIRKQSHQNKKELLNRIQNEEKRIQYIEDALIKNNVMILEVYEQLENIISKYSNELNDEQIIDLILKELNKPKSTTLKKKKQIEDDFILIDEKHERLMNKEQDHLFYSGYIQDSRLDNEDYDVDYDVDWVFMDNIDHENFTLEKIFSFFKSKRNEQRSVQEEGVIMSHTAVFLKNREKYKSIREQSIIQHKKKMLDGLHLLNEKPLFIHSISLPKIVLSNRDKWVSCSICENYFERLSFKLNCELCKNVTCTSCGIHPTSFNIELIGANESRIVELKLCKRCIDVTTYSKNEVINQISNSNMNRGKQYVELSNLKKDVTDCIQNLSKLDSSDIEGMKPLVNKFIKSISEIQTITQSIKANIIKNEQKINQGQSVSIKKTELKFQKLLVASTLTFLLEHRKYINSFKMILQN